MIANTATVTIEKRKSKAAAKKASRLATKPPLTPDRIYTSAEAALAIGVSTITLIRARNAGHLAELRAGRKVLHSGKQLLDWLEAGGRTSAEK
jgi:hypothetical protein